MASLPKVFNRIISFLKREKVSYLVIGGIASSVLGKPRLTEDVDTCLFIKKRDVKNFLNKVKKEGFSFDEKEAIRSARESGVFKISWAEFRVDCLIFSTEFEKKALSRAQKITVYGIEALFPTPEHLILFKIIPARPIDVSDLENIAKRHKGKLDVKYLEKWSERLSDEDMRIYREVKRLLRL